MMPEVTQKPAPGSRSRDSAPWAGYSMGGVEGWPEKLEPGLEGFDAPSWHVQGRLPSPLHFIAPARPLCRTELINRKELHRKLSRVGFKIL